MSDVVDNANDHIEREEAAALKKIQAKAKLDPGVPGECDLCGEYMLRLIHGACAPCRDRHNLP